MILQTNKLANDDWHFKEINTRHLKAKNGLSSVKSDNVKELILKKCTAFFWIMHACTITFLLKLYKNYKAF